MAIMLETISLPKQGLLNLELKISVNIQIMADKAQKLVGVFAGNNIADLRHGDLPDLVMREEGFYWRVPVILSSQSIGRIGCVGSIDVNVETGELLVNNKIITEIKQNAQRFAIGAAL